MLRFPGAGSDWPRKIPSARYCGGNCGEKQRGEARESRSAPRGRHEHRVQCERAHRYAPGSRVLPSRRDFAVRAETTAVTTGELLQKRRTPPWTPHHGGVLLLPASGDPRSPSNAYGLRRRPADLAAAALTVVVPGRAPVEVATVESARAVEPAVKRQRYPNVDTQLNEIAAYRVIVAAIPVVRVLSVATIVAVIVIAATTSTVPIAFGPAFGRAA